MIALHRERGAAATVLTAVVDDPGGLGRIVRGADGAVERIVEAKDASEEERNIREINAGTYVFDLRLLFEALARVKNENRQGEYYLTDVVSILREEGRPVLGYRAADPAERVAIDGDAWSEMRLLLPEWIGERK